MCEWCGNGHDKSALCASRPKWSRRGFLALFGAGIAGAVVAAKAPFVEWAENTSGTIGSINRATYSFWRNQPPPIPSAFDLKAAMRDIYNHCSFDNVPDIISVDRETLKRYEKLLS